MERGRSLVVRHSSLTALFLFALLSAVMTWPVVARLGSHVPGGNVDLWSHRWTYWWIKQAIVEGHDPFYTDLLFHPEGVSLAFHNIAWVNIATWLPLQAVLGENIAYSLTFLIFSTLNGFSMYLLLRDLLGSIPAAIVGGVVYGFWPYTMSHYGHPNMKVTCWVPLTLLYVRRTVRARQARDALLAALFLALTGLTRWQLLFMAAPLVVLFTIRELVREEGVWNWEMAGLFALTLLFAGALMSPLALPVASTLLTHEDTSDILFTEESSGQTDLLAYILPTRYHPFWNQAAELVYDNFIHNKVFVPFIGYTALGLALYAAITRWCRARFWLFVAAIYVALALGPQLRINGELYPGVPMPYRLVGDLFVVRAVRVPHRFNLFLGLPMGVLVSLGVTALIDGRSRRISVLLAGVLSMLVLRGYSLVPYHTERPVTPTWYDHLAQQRERFAVLDLPVALHTYNKQYMFYQITHRKPLVEGKVSRPPHEAFRFVEKSPFLEEVHKSNVMDPALVDVSHQLGFLADADIRYLVLHKRFASPGQMVSWRDWLTFEPLHEDEDLVVYPTDPQLNRDFELVANLGDGVGLIRASCSTTATIQGSVVEVDARWGSFARPRREYDVCLRLRQEEGQITHTHCLPLSPSWPTSRWASGEIVRSRYRIKVPITLEPDLYLLSLELAQRGSRILIGEAASVTHLRVEAFAPEMPLNVRFGDELLLRGYDLVQSDEALQLTFYWQARREMERSYKAFVHLVREVDGAIVAQDDVVPRHWTYPTSEWERGEVVKDMITLSLDDVPRGHYHLRTGWYDPATGERLLVYPENGSPGRDEVVSLGSVYR